MSIAPRLLELAEDLQDAARELTEVANAQQANGTPPSNAGDKIGRKDANGKNLRVGDFVRVAGSARYGDPTGFVVGAAAGEGSTGPRVTVRLDDGRDDSYTPSQGRVTRIERFGSPEHPTTATETPVLA